MGKEQVCCFTGHRPDKLPWGTNEWDRRCLALKEQIRLALERAYEEGYRHFISGMARGSDLYFAEGVLALRARYPDVRLECARPCESQSDRWPEGVRRRYDAILERCDYETMVQHTYDRGCMMRRNRYMVDHASRIISVYDGVPKGGTAQTLAYALRRGLTTDIIPLEGETT